MSYAEDGLMKRIAALIFACLVAGAFAQQQDLNSDTWVATDGLGREVPGHDLCGPMRKDKYVGIFYWTWHTAHSGQGPFDNTKLIAANPDNPQWGPVTAAHHWGEPELGYYISTDRYVIRKHASMLTDAGVDVVIFDTTNPPFTFEDSYMALCDEYAKMRVEGNKTPQIAFLCPFGDPRSVVNSIYQKLYKPGLYKDLWFIWKSKPLIMADPAYFKNTEIAEFFTFRKPIPSYFTGPTGPDQWAWLEVFPQHIFRDSAGNAEQVAVGVAQNAVNEKLGPMSHRDGAYGRSRRNGRIETGDDAVNYGYNFTEQFERALEIDPEFIFITGFNEWVAGHFTEWAGYTGKDTYYPDAVFVDQYNHEYSRDVEPMKGGHGDSYYYLMTDFIRQFKGVGRPPKPSPPTTIKIDGDFSDWTNVAPDYRDTIGDTAHRDHKGYGNLRYTNTTGRNDFVALKVARDSTNIYFYAETKKPVTAHTDSNWMLLFIDADRNNATGWNGYDYLVNADIIDPTTTTIKQTRKGWNWQKKAEVSMHIKDNKIEIMIPRSALGLQDNSSLSFDFHWADNIQKPDDIDEFATSGDSAPNRRFNYRFHE